ncbi:MAG: hypothetical protein M3072_07210 [Candidatus Dormibacteraeota bacterium]|nr:hypothetical protein [Candidatus Dormibacteraeota bacterium]
MSDTPLSSVAQALAHRPRLVRAADVHPHTGFNKWLAVKLTTGVGTMWCAYAFAILAIVGFPLGSTNPTQYVQWASQTFIQLVMLSVIMVGQNVISAAQDARAEADHETLGALHAIAVSTAALQETQLAILHELERRR